MIIQCIFSWVSVNLKLFSYINLNDYFLCTDLYKKKLQTAVYVLYVLKNESMIYF